GSRRAGSLGKDVISIEVRHAVDIVQSRCDHGFVAAAMASPARDDLPATEGVAIDTGDHLHHTPCHGLSWSGGLPSNLIGAGSCVAVGAAKPKGCGHDSHGSHEIVHRDSLQRLDILEDFLRLRLLLSPGLNGRG